MYRVVDQMLTAHSALRDRFLRRALGLDLAILIPSAILVAGLFVDPEIARRVLPAKANTTLVLGIVSLIVFAASIVQIKVDWAGKAALHGKAFDALLSIKHALGRLHRIEDESQWESEFRVIRSTYELVGSLTVLIPDAEFLRLKRKHLLKIAVSKLLDKRPGAFAWYLRLTIILRDIRKHHADE